MKSIIDLLYESERKFPEKIAIQEPNQSITYQTLLMDTKRMASCISEQFEVMHQPIVVLIDKSIAAFTSMMAVLMSGNFYTILDVKTPKDRLEKIISTLETPLMITDQKNVELALELCSKDDVLLYEKAKLHPIIEEPLSLASQRMIDTDPAYVLFTSGSTGMPKGTVVSHRSVMAYAKWVCETFLINEHTIFGNQTPFYFSMSVLDIFSTLKAGATLVLIPKLYFSFPAKLLTYLKEQRVNTIYWVPSALGIIANLNGLEAILPTAIHTVLFAGEVMPTKILNYWRNHLPEATYANLYGPTEVTDICTYYVVNREFQDDEPLPIGNACNNCDVLVLNDQDKLVKQDEVGELCVRGSFLADGYYNAPEKTTEVFVQNPLQSHYPERIYRTGDLVNYNSYGELMYVSRKDFQIKHMGYRIELGEIEMAIFALKGITSCACIYDDKSRLIVLFYEGNGLEERDVLDALRKKVPPYMVPNKIYRKKRLPHNANGKIDRKALKKQYEEGE